MVRYALLNNNNQVTNYIIDDIANPPSGNYIVNTGSYQANEGDYWIESIQDFASSPRFQIFFDNPINSQGNELFITPTPSASVGFKFLSDINEVSESYFEIQEGTITDYSFSDNTISMSVELNLSQSHNAIVSLNNPIVDEYGNSWNLLKSITFAYDEIIEEE